MLTISLPEYRTMVLAEGVRWVYPCGSPVFSGCDTVDLRIVVKYDVATPR